MFMAESVWSVLPPLITIALALWTKEVYMSLIIGIFSGAMFFTGGNIIESILTMFAVMADKVGSNVNILVFLVVVVPRQSPREIDYLVKEREHN